MTNISLSNLTSWTLGGGRAIATPIKPITEDDPDVPEEAANPEEEWCWFEEDDAEDDWLCELFDELDLFLEPPDPNISGSDPPFQKAIMQGNGMQLHSDVANDKLTRQ